MGKEERTTNVEELADKIYEDLRVFFQETMPAERRIRLEVRPIERSVQVDEEQVDGHLVLLFHTPAGLVVKGHFLINYRGGNMYGVAVGFSDEESRTAFTLSVPEPGIAGKGDASYTHDLVMYVLDELERITGEHILREATEKSDADSS